MQKEEGSRTGKEEKIYVRMKKAERFPLINEKNSYYKRFLKKHKVEEKEEEAKVVLTSPKQGPERITPGFSYKSQKQV